MLTATVGDHTIVPRRKTPAAVCDGIVDVPWCEYIACGQGTTEQLLEW